jgi:hypothetical protein
MYNELIKQYDLILIVCLLIIVVYFIIVYTNSISNESNVLNSLSQNFYEVDDIEQKLDNIYQHLHLIQFEVNQIIQQNNWIDWPEKYLYDGSEDIIKKTLKNNNSWTIYPFFAFGTIIPENCAKCPNLWNFLKTIPNIRLATLSKLGPGTKLNTHQGWGNHSNNVIRCHFGFDVPYGCCMSVRDNLYDDEEIRLHHNHRWLLFDDSRHHYAYNPTKRSRVILIVDVDRPSNIKTGTSKIGDTKELLQIIEYFTHRKINIIDYNLIKTIQ